MCSEKEQGKKKKNIKVIKSAPGKTNKKSGIRLEIIFATVVFATFEIYKSQNTLLLSRS